MAVDYYSDLANPPLCTMRLVHICIRNPRWPMFEIQKSRPSENVPQRLVQIIGERLVKQNALALSRHTRTHQAGPA